jgi:hypothetical protein
MQHQFALSLAALAALLAPAIAAERLPNTAEANSPSIAWHDDYHAGLGDAQARRKLALIWFYDPQSAAENDRLQQTVLAQPSIAALLQQHFVALKLPANASALSQGENVTLLNHPAFFEMRRSPGLAILDMTDESSPVFRQVVSVYPFTRGPISAEKLAVLLDLPRGTLTQRTLIFAVRTHPESPASTTGHFSQILTRETENHAWHQASITLQGHHNWDSRFHAINAQLPGGLAAREVCAESWPGQNLLDAAEECVHSWRQSPGHWQAVSSPHTLFAYDMKRGHNGTWYAAGIFASR